MLPSSILPLTLVLPPAPAFASALPGRRTLFAAPLAATYKPPPRQPYRRRPPPPRTPHPHCPSNAAFPPPSRGALGQEELEEAIYDFMRRSDKPGAFPTRAELLAAGRADLASAVESSGGWLSLGWSSGDAAGPALSCGPGVHPDYPPVASASDLSPGVAASYVGEAEASPSGRRPETEETAEEGSGAGLEGMLSRLQKERERARPPPRSNNRAGGLGDIGCTSALMNLNGAPSHTATGGVYSRRLAENINSDSSHSQNGTIRDNEALRSSSNDAWRSWSLDKGVFSDFQAAEVSPSDRRKLTKNDHLDIALVQDDVPGPSNGVVANGYAIDHVDSERDEIHSRLQNLELDLTSALETLRSRFDRVLSDVSNGNGENMLNGLSDDWEFEETKVMRAQEELRSIRAKIAVLEGKMALEIIERNKIIEEKQRRLDEVEKALSELRTVYVVWPNPASEVLLAGSFDGWTSQRRMERSERGIFSLSLRLYPGRYEIKFIVDGVWRNDPLRPAVNNHGHENNLLIVS